MLKVRLLVLSLPTEHFDKLNFVFDSWVWPAIVKPCWQCDKAMYCTCKLTWFIVLTIWQDLIKRTERKLPFGSNKEHFFSFLHFLTLRLWYRCVWGSAPTQKGWVLIRWYYLHMWINFVACKKQRPWLSEISWPSIVILLRVKREIHIRFICPIHCPNTIRKQIICLVFEAWFKPDSKSVALSQILSCQPNFSN